MRILLDECVPPPFRKDLPGHEVVTVREMGWAGLENGDLLRVAEGDFDVFLTVDRNLQYQQNLGGYNIAVVSLVARSNRLESFRALAPSVLRALRSVQPGNLVRISEGQ